MIRRVVQALLLAALAPVLAMGQRPTPLCFVIGDRVAYVSGETVDQSLFEAVRDLPAATTALAIVRNLGGWRSNAVAADR